MTKPIRIEMDITELKQDILTGGMDLECQILNRRSISMSGPVLPRGDLTLELPKGYDVKRGSRVTVLIETPE